jgi:hypothetical protein
MMKLKLALVAAFMSDVLPTVKIQTENGPVEINFTDYDPNKHKLVDAKDLPPLKPLDPAKREMLFGSNIQPSTWTLGDGSTLQLGTVVAEAHKRSGHTVEGWNALPNDDREKFIADVVAEMVPTAPAGGFKTGKRGRGATTKFFVVDGAGKQVGEEYSTEDEAKEQAAILNGEEIE